MSKFLVTIFLSLFVSVSFAVTDPVSLLQNHIASLQQQVSSQHASLAQSSDKLYAIVRQNVMPLIDIEKMAGMTLGPKWRDASPAEKDQFIDAFGLLLTHIYANSLLQVANYKITLFPLRGNRWETANQLVVRGQVTGGTSDQPSNVAYYLERSGDSWKIYDFAVEGVSIVKNYQSQFISFPNMTTVLVKLNQLNQQNQAGQS